MIPFIIGALGLIAYGLSEENNKPKAVKKMAKGGGVNSFDKIFAEYEDNEDNNYHSENVVLLAKNFGSAEDLKLAKSILKKHESEGSLSGELGKQRFTLHQKLYPKLIASKPKMAKGGIVVTSIKDIPNFKERNKEGKITYRGLGLGKLFDDFYNVAGEQGVKIKVDGKEYFITDTEFNTFSRGSDGKMRIRFDAPYKKGYANGGELDTWENILVDYGFKKSRTKLGVKFYKKHGYSASIDNKGKKVELYFDDIELYSGYSNQLFISELEKEFKH
jgi:hypothetical protein